MNHPSSRALLSLWNGIAAHRIAEYDRWHTLEHVPERVWVPGFVSGTRYVGEAPGQVRYFTLYELESLDCLSSAAYQDLVDRPTPWSASMRPSMTGFLRKTGVVVASAGAVQGSCIGITRLVWDEATPIDAAAWQALAARVLADGANGCVSRVRLQQVVAAGAQVLGNQDVAPAGREMLCLVESADPQALQGLGDLVMRSLAAIGLPAPLWHHPSRYALTSRVDHADVRAAARPAPRLDLMPASGSPAA